MSLDYLSGRSRSIFLADQKDNPVFQEYLRTGGYVNQTTNTAQDETFTFEREMQDNYVTGLSISAPDLASNFRLDSQNLKMLVYGIQADYATPEIDANVSGTLDFTLSTNTVGGADLSAIKVNTYFKLTIGSESWVVRAAQDGTGTGVVIYPGIIKADVTGAAGTAKVKAYKSGDFRHQFYMQSRVKGTTPDGSAEKIFYRNFTGMEIFSWTMDAATESFVTLGVNMTGLSRLASDDPNVDADGKINGQTDVAKEDKAIISTGLHLGMIYVNSAPVECRYSNFSFTYDNSGEELDGLFCEGAAAIGYGNPTGTGSLSAYVKKANPFEYEDMRDNRTTFDLGLMMKDDTDTVVLSMPKTRITSANQDEGGSAAVSANDISCHGNILVYIF